MKGLMQYPVLGLLLLGLCFASARVMAATSAADSFSPIYATDTKGRPLRLSWTYVVNQGKPLRLDFASLGRSIRLTCRFGLLKMRIDPKNRKRKVSLPVTISGAANGSAIMKVTEELQPLDAGRTLIDSRRGVVDLKISAGGRSVRLRANVLARFAPPVEWFLDRNDLDHLGIGYVFEQEPFFEVNLQGKVCVFVSGFRRCAPVNETSLSTDTWTITGMLETLKVGKKTYSNVVEVQRQTANPSLDSLGGEVSTEPATMTYWVAKGIGIVKETGQYSFMGYPLDLELKKFTRTRVR